MFQVAFLCLIIFQGQEVAAELDTGYEYIEEADTWLRLHIVPAEWQEARLRCKLEGGVLASPSTTSLTNAMIAMMMKYNYVLSRGVFTGIHDLISEGDFMSLDGTPVSNMQLNWGWGEPSDNDKTENCVKLMNMNEVADESCTTKHAYFCRKENASMVVDKKCNTTAVGYEYNSRATTTTSSNYYSEQVEQIITNCYKFHRVARTWHQAARVCHLEGGHLAIINSETEDKVIQQIFSTKPADTIVGAAHDFLAFIGVWKWNDEHGEWFTVHDQNLAEAGFVQWSDGQPNNMGGDQTVLSVERDGKFNDVSPDLKLAFICEIS